MVVRIERIVPPTEEVLKTKLDQYREQATTTVSTTLTNSVLNQLKSVGKIDFDQAILGS